jgi:hypothetical protein
LVYLVVFLKSLMFCCFSLFTFLLIWLDNLLFDFRGEFPFQFQYFSVLELPYVPFIISLYGYSYFVQMLLSWFPSFLCPWVPYSFNILKTLIKPLGLIIPRPRHHKEWVLTNYFFLAMSHPFLILCMFCSFKTDILNITFW